jgi:hypothetical protein
MQSLQAPGLSHDEKVSLKRLAVGTQHASIPSKHLELFKKLTLIESRGATWKLTPLGLRQLRGMPKPARITSADPLALLETMMTMYLALRQHRTLVREREAVRPGNSAVPASRPA